MQRRELLLSCVIGGVVPAAARAQSTDYPKAGTTLRYVVPFPPGGGSPT